MTAEPDEPESHQWPGCPWPGWAHLYARLIRDCRAMDPDLIVELHVPGTIGFDSVTTGTEGDVLFDRMAAAERESEDTCVVCGAAAPGPGWPPLCKEHA